MKVRLAILGGGGAAFAAAAKANELGVKTALINKGLPLGGTCVNVGCVPSKFLLEIGFDRWRAVHPRFRALSSVLPAFDFAEVIAEKEEVVARNRRSKYQEILAGFKHVELIEERAQFEAPGRIRAGHILLEANQVLIATGSSNKPLHLPGMENLSETDVLDNIRAFGLRALPKSMMVLGGGPMGLETAQIFAHLGTKVTVIEAQDRVLAITEPEVSRTIQKIFTDDGIEVHTSTQVKAVRKLGNEIALTVGKQGHELEFRAEKLFVAIGVKGNTEDLNLSAIDLQADKNGFIAVDEQMRTQAPDVWAAGDVAGPPWLETLAAREGVIAVQNAFNSGKMTTNYDAVPFAVFTEPQVASVGLTEDESMHRLGRCNCRTVELRFVPKADITNQVQGIAKMAIHPDTRKILGFHLVSPNAAEIIHEAALAIQSGLTVEDIINLVHVFPTYSEVVKITAQAYHRDVKHMSCCVE